MIIQNNKKQFSGKCAWNFEKLFSLFFLILFWLIKMLLYFLFYITKHADFLPGSTLLENFSYFSRQYFLKVNKILRYIDFILFLNFNFYWVKLSTIGTGLILLSDMLIYLPNSVQNCFFDCNNHIVAIICDLNYLTSYTFQTSCLLQVAYQL